MLKSGNKFFVAIGWLLLVISCDNYNDKMSAKKSTNRYVADRFDEYGQIYMQINDSIKVYIDSMTSAFSSEYLTEWHLDSLLCVNSANDKLVTTVNESSGSGTDIKSDQIEKLLGKKIEGKWYFFKAGESLVVPRDMYGKSGIDPLTFYELSQIARKEFLESALIKKSENEYIVHDEWIDRHFYNNALCAKCATKEEFDEAHLRKIINQRKEKIDTNEYKPLRKHKFNR